MTLLARATVGAGWLSMMISLACSPAGVAPPRHSAASTEGADADVRDYSIRGIEARLQSTPPGADHDYLAGIVASRSERIDDAILLLNRALPVIRVSQPERAAVALEALANTYSRSYRYREAAHAYDDLEQHFAHLPLDVADDAALARILVDAPAQTIVWNGPVRLSTSRNPIGSLTTALTVNGIQQQWLLDTGANQSVVSRSFAQKLGLAPLPGTAMVGSGVTGLKSPLRAAIVPTLKIGGATVSNVVTIILDDADLRIGGATDGYQINAILGYPVLSALETITFTHGGEFLAGAAADVPAGVPMYMRGLTPAIECEIEGEPLLFTFDTGASTTGFSVRYYERFQRLKGSWRTQTVETGGAGGTLKRDMYLQPTVVVKIGAATVTLSDVSVFSSRMNSGIDVLFGNLGQDVVANFERFSLDFKAMRFSLGAPL